MYFIVHYIINSIFSRLRRLNLGGNELQKIPSDAMSILEFLKRLELQENLISSIKKGDFHGKF